MCSIIRYNDKYMIDELGGRVEHSEINMHDMFNLYAYIYMRNEFNFRNINHPSDRICKKIRTMTYLYALDIKAVELKSVKQEPNFHIWSYLLEVKSIINTLFGKGLISDLIVDYCKT